MTRETAKTPLTAHDLLKTFAVVIMVIDHIGYYFYPDEMWWRAIGRIGFPIWFYLVGHASGRGLPLKLWGGAFVLLAMNVVVGMSILPLNALFTIIMLRLLIDPVMAGLRRMPQILWPMLAAMVLLIIPTNAVTEYGTQALMFAILGYMVRHKESMSLPRRTVERYMVAITVIFAAFQYLAFGFDAAQFAVMTAGTVLVCILLLDFKGREFPELSAMTPGLVKGFCRVCGHRTLEIYVIHLLLFKAAATLLGLSNDTPFHFHIF